MKKINAITRASMIVEPDARRQKKSAHAKLTIGFMFVLLALSAALAAAMFAAPDLQPQRGQFLVFGPYDFVRTAGKPALTNTSFGAPSVNTEYLARIYNGGADGRYGRNSSAVVTLNGALVASESDFNQKAQLIEKQVTLSAQNNLSVDLRSSPGSGITVAIVGVDNDPPTITGNKTPPANSNNWNKSEVTVSFDCADAISGIASCTGATVVNMEGADQIVTGTASDKAGNTATAMARVSLDKTAPTIIVISPSDGAVVNTSDVTITGTVNDSLSGVESVTCNGAPALLSGANFSCLQSLVGGSNNLSIQATDRAGNQAATTRTINHGGSSDISHVKIDPDVVFVAESRDVYVHATIPYDPAGPTPQVVLQRVDEFGRVIGIEGTLADDGNKAADGDASPRDGIFTFHRVYAPQTQNKIRLQISFQKDSREVRSEVLRLNFFKRPTSAEVNTILQIQSEAMTSYQSLLSGFGADPSDEARAMIAEQIVEQIKQNPAVRDAGATDSGITILYRIGIVGGLDFLNSDVRGGLNGAGSHLKRESAMKTTDMPHSQQILAEDTSDPPEEADRISNKRAILIAPFRHDGFLGGEVDAIGQDLRSSQCPTYDVVTLQDQQGSVAAFQNLDQYGIVVIATHGEKAFSQIRLGDEFDGGPVFTLNEGPIIFMSHELATPASIPVHMDDLEMTRLAIINYPSGPLFGVFPSFIDHYSTEFPDSLIYAGACYSGKNTSMASAFLNKGARAYLGFTKPVSDLFASNVGTQFFARFLDDPLREIGGTDGAFIPGQLDPYPCLKRPVDCQDPIERERILRSKAAEFVKFGSDTLEKPDPGLLNGDFEKGNFFGWDFWGLREVDHAVTQFGEFVPTSGKFMATISNRVGGVGSVEQKFCLPADAKRLEFDWNYITEDYGYCVSGGPPWYRLDPFYVYFERAPSFLQYVRANDFCNELRVTPDLTFSYGLPVKTTGWKHSSIDISQYAAANAGRPALLHFSVFGTDVRFGPGYADGSGHTVVLIDNIKIAE